MSNPVQRVVARRPHRPFSEQGPGIAQEAQRAWGGCRRALAGRDRHGLAPCVVRDGACRTDHAGRQAVRPRCLQLSGGCGHAHRCDGAALDVEDRRGDRGLATLVARWHPDIAAGPAEGEFASQRGVVSLPQVFQHRLLACRVRAAQDGQPGGAGTQGFALPQARDRRPVRAAVLRAGHHQQHRLGNRVAQAVQRILAGEAQVEVAPDLVCQFQRTEPEQEGLVSLRLAQQAFTHQRAEDAVQRRTRQTRGVQQVGEGHRPPGSRHDVQQSPWLSPALLRLLQERPPHRRRQRCPETTWAACPGRSYGADARAARVPWRRLEGRIPGKPRDLRAWIVTHHRLH